MHCWCSRRGPAPISHPGVVPLAAAVAALLLEAAAEAISLGAVSLDWPSCARDASCLFTRESLRPFVGDDGGGDILLSVVSYVFNVTSAPHYYSKRIGSYSALAGIDCSRTLGTMSMEDEDVASHSLADFTDEQWEELFGWIDKFQEKYPLVGRLLGWDPGVSIDEINRRSGFSLKPAALPPPTQQAAVGKLSGGQREL
mmetsp:Transcript_102427/g.285449  ORF Transcript_102427/g.285449 Transcript_102427/m.285449 type:complete len:199 (+) Transcript_102427:114-710(+)